MVAKGAQETQETDEVDRVCSLYGRVGQDRSSLVNKLRIFPLLKKIFMKSNAGSNTIKREKDERVSHSKQIINWTIAQRQAIEADSHARVLVDAGPGTGKTATACARVAWLIEKEGIEPNKILITSFTNAAIHEILKRISSFLDEPEKALGIKISTLDSFSWSLRAGFNNGNLELKGFVENIEQAAELLEVDESAKEYLRSIEHFVVDEAQDITGPRAALVISIIQNLEESSGVSIFSDEAQAIYGFTEDETPEYFGNTLPKDIRAHNELKGTFSSINLTEIHRTSDEKLRNLFSKGRKLLLDVDDVDLKTIYQEVRELVVETHHKRVGTAFEILVKQDTSEDLNSNDFLLFRTRSDALQASHYMGTLPYRLRLSGFPVLIEPWIARCFWDHTEDRISESDFAELYLKRTGSKDFVEAEGKWRDLHREVGTDAHRISIRRLSNLLSRPNVPSCFSSPDYGVSGPILGTIHASKGRETDNVWLFVPNEPHYRKVAEDRRFEEILEEARILFVGATRSKQTLVISDTKGGRHFKRSGNMNKSKRAFTIKDANAKKCALEIGRKGDISAEGLAGSGNFDSEGEVMLAQKALWNRRQSSIPLQANASKDKNFTFEVSIDYAYADPRYKDSHTSQKFTDKLFCLNQSVNSDLFLAGKIMGQKVKPPSKFRHFYSLGARSLVLSSDDPARELLFEPWSQSGFMLAPILVGYPDIYLQSYGGI